MHASRCDPRRPCMWTSRSYIDHRKLNRSTNGNELIVIQRFIDVGLAPTDRAVASLGLVSAKTDDFFI